LTYIASFVAGFLSTLLFHQGLLGLLFAAGVVGAAPYAMQATAPLGVPQVISLAFWGGVWGVVMWLAIGRVQGLRHWGLALAIGAVGPTVVAMLVVFPMKGIAVTATKWVGGLILNGAWGLGTAALMRLYATLPRGRD
jgi:hypothetical protein